MTPCKTNVLFGALVALLTAGCSDTRTPFIEPPAPDHWVVEYTTPEGFCVGVYNEPSRSFIGRIFNAWTIHPARINFAQQRVERFDGKNWVPVPKATLVPDGDDEIRQMLRIYKSTTP
jgi:hypothetical protein